MKSMKSDKWVVKTIVPEEVYTDREEFLEYFYNTALNAARRGSTSTVLLGKSRIGKTEIFKRVVNRLFFEQDPRDPNAVAPVYFSFPGARIDVEGFAKRYIENFIRYYTAFYTNRPELIREEPRTEVLISIIKDARDVFPSAKTIDLLLSKHLPILTGDGIVSWQTALETPRRISDIEDSTIVVFLDEIQNTRLFHDNFEIVDFMREAVDSPACPHFVTGSPMNMLAEEIIGRGTLSGRFDSKDIGPLSEYDGAGLAQRAAVFYGAELSDRMAPVAAERCGGYPYYITAVARRAAELARRITDEPTLDEILGMDIASGFIWSELRYQVIRWISLFDDYDTTKWILYLAALEEERRIDLHRIQKELWRHEKKEVDLELIRDVLIKLSRGDLIDYSESGDPGESFEKRNDPILNEFLRVWGAIEVKGQNRHEARSAAVRRYMNSRKKLGE